MIPPKYFHFLVDNVENNPKVVGTLLLILCGILSYLIVSLVKAISIFGFLLVGLYLYREGFHEKTLLRYGVDNQIAKIVFFVIILVALFFVFRKAPMLVLACLFGVIGSLMTVMVIECSFEVDWGFYRMLTHYRNHKTVIETPEHFITYLIAAGICIANQVYMVIRGKT
ncbi:hypothetical protein GVAV_000973 [Gurleya vavrai]